MTKSFVLFAVLTFSCGDNATPSSVDAPVASADAPPDPRFAGLAAAIEAERVADGVPGVAVAVIENGEITWAAGFGTAGPERDLPVRSSTLFRIGSVNKMLTATAVMQLVASGDVALDAPITDYLPNFRVAGTPGAESITVRHLLAHTHAMRDYLAIDGGRTDEDLSTFLHSNIWRNNVYLMAPSGRLWNYSNPGYYVAGLIVEEKTGVPYRQALRDRVFAPLGMDRTFFLGSEVLADGDYANGATVDWVTGNGARTATPDAYDNAWARPAGYAWSSVLDLARFANFVMAGDSSVLPEAQRAEMQSEQVDTEVLGDIMHYGYGLFVERGIFLGPSDYRDEKIVSHGGDINGFAATLVTVPRTRFAIVVLANTDGAHFDNSVALALKDFAGLPPSSAPPDLTEDPANLDRYVGTYHDPRNIGTVVVTRTNNVLTVDMPDLDAANIPYSPTLTSLREGNFILKVQGFNVLLTFIVDEQGNGEYFRTRFFVARRQAMPLSRPAPQRPQIQIEDLVRAERDLDRLRRRR